MVIAVRNEKRRKNDCSRLIINFLETEFYNAYGNEDMVSLKAAWKQLEITEGLFPNKSNINNMQILFNFLELIPTLQKLRKKKTNKTKEKENRDMFYVSKKTMRNFISVPFIFVVI